MAQQRRKPKSEYGLQLQEKQQLKDTYALRERKFRRYFEAGKDPEEIMRMLESRLDNVIFRAGFATTRRAARQIVNHGHIQVNGKNINLPAYSLKTGDTITIHPSSKNIGPLKDLSIVLQKYEAPEWLVLDKKSLRVKISAIPLVDEVLIESSIRPTIEFYSR